MSESDRKGTFACFALAGLPRATSVVDFRNHDQNNLHHHSVALSRRQVAVSTSASVGYDHFYCMRIIPFPALSNSLFGPSAYQREQRLCPRQVSAPAGERSENICMTRSRNSHVLPHVYLIRKGLDFQASGITLGSSSPFVRWRITSTFATLRGV